MEKKEEKKIENENLKQRLDLLYGDAVVDKNHKRKDMSEEEKRKVKKQMVLLIWFIVAIIAIMIASVFFPIKNKDKELSKVEQVEEKGPEVLPIGDVDLDNEVIEKIDCIFNFDSSNPLYNPNVLNLFNDKVNINELDFDTIMLLLTSTNQFTSFMLTNTNFNKFNPDADANLAITISKDDIKNQINQLFNQDLNLEYKDFKYYFNYGKDKVVYFNARLDDDIYYLEPTVENIQTGIFVHKKLVLAENYGDEIILRYRVLYSNNNGIYSDKELTKFVTNDFINIDKYLEYANRYEFVFYSAVKDNNNVYYLKSINKFDFEIGG